MSGRPVLLISGPPGAGKSTVAAELASRFEPSVHLRTDLFFRSIQRGYVEPWKLESAAQNAVVVRAAARSATAFADAGYLTTLDGVVLPWALKLYREELTSFGLDLRAAILLPDVEETLGRGIARTNQYGMDESVYREMHRQFVAAYAGSTELLVVRQTARVQELTDLIVAAFELPAA